MINAYNIEFVDVLVDVLDFAGDSVFLSTALDHEEGVVALLRVADPDFVVVWPVFEKGDLVLRPSFFDGDQVVISEIRFFFK